MGRRVWADRDECDVGLRGMLASRGRSWRHQRLFAARMSIRSDEMGAITCMFGLRCVMARPDAIS